MYRNLRSAVTALLVIITLIACSSTPHDDDSADETLHWTAEKFYQEAKNTLKIGDYQSAIDYLEKLEARYPFGRYAQQAQLEIAYAYYKYDESESAISAADRFIKLHPRHANVDYAYYLKGLASYPAENDFLEDFMDKDQSKLDPGAARRSFGYFSTLAKKFPDSKYVAESKKRMRFLRNNLAKHEVNVANFYIRRGAYVAAANRAKYILENYQQTPSIPKALTILKNAYEKLNISDLANDTDRIIKFNQQAIQTRNKPDNDSIEMEEEN